MLCTLRFLGQGPAVDWGAMDRGVRRTVHQHDGVQRPGPVHVPSDGRVPSPVRRLPQRVRSERQSFAASHSVPGHLQTHPPSSWGEQVGLHRVPCPESAVRNVIERGELAVGRVLAWAALLIVQLLGWFRAIEA